MYAVALRRIEPSKRMARFYAVTVLPTLFGGWAVVRRWGRINTDGRRAETWFEDLSPALVCADRHTAAKRRRGYRELAYSFEVCIGSSSNPVLDPRRS